MTYQISDNCIACGNCLPNCPTGAITQTDQGKYYIDSNLCNNCIGSYGVAQCMAVCPTPNACHLTPSSLLRSNQTTTTTYWEQWFCAYEHLVSKLKAKQETKYWHSWFNTYSQKLERLMISH